MKAAPILQPRDADVCTKYARDNNFEPLILVTVSYEMNFTEMLAATIEDAKARGCVEFAFRDIEQGYNVLEDKLLWRLSIFAFRPIT